jgi:hypothetical protein
MPMLLKNQNGSQQVKALPKIEKQQYNQRCWLFEFNEAFAVVG